MGMENLRIQKSGNQKPWKLEELRAGFENFYTNNKHYPTAPEIDASPYLPSARTIERSFGGLVELRKALGLNTQTDLREGVHSSKRARTINLQANKATREVSEYLVKRFGADSVHSEYSFFDDKRTRVDFFIKDKSVGFCVEVLCPSGRRNLIGCINNKLARYQSQQMSQLPVIFLQMNKELDQELLDNVIKNKQKKLSAKQHLFSLDTFKEFCNKRSAK